MNLSKNPCILIIGGGIIGLSLARELHIKGVRKITILERGKIGGEATSAAAGMLAPQAEAEKPDNFFHFCSDSKNLYINFADQLFAETGVDIELDRNGTLYLAFSEADVMEIRRRYDWQKKAGLAVEHLSAEEVRKAEPFVSPDVREALFFPNDWQVENRKLLIALQKYAELNCIEIVEDAEVKNLLTENGKAIGAETSDKKFFAETTVLATGAWTSFIKSGENALCLPKVKPIRGQMLSFKTAKRLFSKVIYSPRGYIVPRFDGRILIGATVEDAGFDKNITISGINFLLETASEISPNLANLEIFDKWAGLRPFASDGSPILGAIPEIENLFIATAHFRYGILLAPLTAKILAEKIVENLDSKYLEIFSPSRFQTKKENLGINITIPLRVNTDKHR
ncbi:MAG TPA: glycine oxidase ThiO [Pyrinomonadaceae bacterium]|nr:glycine oxidase ThiO [Pyrinomonadaceae bacterium]